jgi:hypothetical protein
MPAHQGLIRTRSSRVTVGEVTHSHRHDRGFRKHLESAPSPSLRSVPDHHVYEPLEAPDVEVEVDGQWWPGEARMRTTRDDGRLTYDVRWHREGSTYLDKFPAERVRLDTIDRSYGRRAEDPKGESVPPRRGYVGGGPFPYPPKWNVAGRLRLRGPM